MKTIKKLLIVLIVLNVFISVAQNKSFATNDLPLRQSLAAKYLKENFFDYKTAEAKASHAIILKAFEKTSEIINLNLNNVADPEDKANLNSFIGGLNSILILTPNWDDLVKLEKDKLIFEDKALNRKPQFEENKAQQK
ncbi:MAG: hypothetical protein H0U95_00095 [Bacteroidetes bacterium]|nr:hypothetical protein [Bacteroidota bacterium]